MSVHLSTCMSVQLYLIFKLLSTAPSFTGQPGVLRSYTGLSVTLRWSLNEPTNSAWKYVDFIFETSIPTTILRWDIATQSIAYGSGYNSLKAKVDVMIGSPAIRLTLFNVQPDDVKYNYRCSVKYDRFSDAVYNNQGWLILYGNNRNVVLFVLLLYLCINKRSLKRKF